MTYVSTDPEIRQRSDRDRPLCLDALREVHMADGYPSSWPADPWAWLSPKGQLEAWVAVSGGAIAGHVVVGTVDDRADPQLSASSGIPAGKLAEIKRLFVRPTARNRGIARMLLDRAASRAIALGLHPVLEVTADREAAVRFYERAGWRRIGSGPATWTRANGERPLMHQYELQRR